MAVAIAAFVIAWLTGRTLLSYPSLELAMTNRASSVIMADAIFVGHGLTGLRRKAVAILVLQVSWLTGPTLLSHPSLVLTMTDSSTTIGMADTVLVGHGLTAFRYETLAILVLQQA